MGLQRHLGLDVEVWAELYLALEHGAILQAAGRLLDLEQEAALLPQSCFEMLQGHAVRCLMYCAGLQSRYSVCSCPVPEGSNLASRSYGL